jgi:hypothetical protein
VSGQCLCLFPVKCRLLPLCASSVRRDNDTVLNLEVVTDPVQGAGLGVEVVDRDVEEALDLGSVQVHSDDMVTTSGLKHVSHQTRGDGSTGFVLLILASVGKVGQDCGDAAGRGRLAGIDHDEQLHDTVVDVAGGSGLKDKDWKTLGQQRASWPCLEEHLQKSHTILVTDRLANANGRLVVGVLKHHDLGQIDPQTVLRIVLVLGAYVDCSAKLFFCLRARYFHMSKRCLHVGEGD